MLSRAQRQYTVKGLKGKDQLKAFTQRAVATRRDGLLAVLGEVVHRMKKLMVGLLVMLDDGG